MSRKFLFLILFQIFVFLSPGVVFGSVYINEIAWMGNSENANAEWIELYNNGQDDVDLSGWTISGSVSISIEDKKNISSGDYFLLERTSDSSVSNIEADQIYTGALSNTGGSLVLSDSEGSVLDRVDFSSGWPAGDNTTKDTMQKAGNSWVTSTPTPKSKNSEISNEPTVNTQNINSNSNSSTIKPSTISDAPKYRDMILKIISVGNTVPAKIDQQFKALVYGNYGEALHKGILLWNFGDGATVYGSLAEEMSHTYTHPGEYVLSVQYFKNTKDESSDLEEKINIKVVSSELVISSFNSTARDSFVEIENKAKYEIALKDWKLVGGGKIFTFPSGTYIKSGNKAIFDLSLMGFDSFGFNTVALLRPGFEIESTYGDIPANTRESSSPKVKYIQANSEIIEGNKDSIDINNLASEAGATNFKIPSVLLLSVIILSAVFIFLFSYKNKRPESDDLGLLSDSDIEIIE